MRGYSASQLLELLPEECPATQEAIRNDVCLWGEHHFYIPETGKQIQLYPHQKAVLKAALHPCNGPRFPYSTILWGTIKKTGKTANAGLVGRWMSETQLRYGQIYATGNDAEQAAGRAYKAIRTSIELTPGYQKGVPGSLPGRWQVQDSKMLHLPSGSTIRPISVDYRGEAGGNPSLTLWTELWGYTHEDSKRFWEEMTPVPTQPISIRWVETYAGYDGESELLAKLYKLGREEGRQITAGELAAMSGEPLGVFEEGISSASPVPIWINSQAGLFMFWDEGINARRFDWLRGEKGEAYYREQEQTLPPNAFDRLHRNLWVGAESEFVPIEIWDANYDPTLQPLLSGSREPVVVGVDAASTGDCFAVVGVTRHPLKHEEPAQRFSRKWSPPKGGRIDYSEPEQYLRQLVADYNVIQFAYDQYQLEDMMQRFTREGLVWCQQFGQMQNRAVADRGLYDKIIRREMAHMGDKELREHVVNSNAKHQKDQDSTMRIVKKTTDRKIDLVVALSMATDRCLELII